MRSQHLASLASSHGRHSSIIVPLQEEKFASSLSYQPLFQNIENTKYFLCLFSLSAPFSGYNNFGYSEPIFDRLADSDSLGHSPSYCFYAFFTSGAILGSKLKGFQGKSILESKKTAISRKSGYKPNLATKFL